MCKLLKQGLRYYVSARELGQRTTLIVAFFVDLAHSAGDQNRLTDDMTTQVHWLSVCGWRVRLWTFDALGFTTSEIYHLDRDEDILSIATLFALVLSPQAKQVRMPAEFGLDSKIIAALSGPWQTLPVGTLLSCFGRTATCWYAPIGPNHPGEAYILKATWVPRHLREHEWKMLQIVCNPSNIASPKEVFQFSAIPATTRTWLRNGQVEQLFLIATVTRHFIGESIKLNPASINERISFLKLHKQLYVELLRLAKLGIHYRDLHTGNVLRARVNHGQLCLIDFDRARHNLEARGDRSNLGVTSDSTVANALDDGRSATLYFAPTAYTICGEELRKAEIAERYAKLQEGKHRSRPRKTQGEATAEREKDMHHVLAVTQHRFIDDLESAIYLQLYQVCYQLVLIPFY